MRVVVAMSGEAGPSATFDLGLHGVRAFIEKPLTLDRLEAAIERALQPPPSLGPTLRQRVGHVGLQDVQSEVRSVMIEEALARERGSRRGAARLLTVSRQLLQYLLRRKK